MITATATLRSSISVTATLKSTQVGSCPDATVQVNGVDVDTVASGGTYDQAIHDSSGADIGTSANPSVVGDATVTINGDSLGASGSVVAEGSVNISVNLNGLPNGSWDGDSWEVTSIADELRQDYQPEGTPYTFYSYIGVAPNGSAEADAVWFITRILHNPNGTTATATAENVAWTDRLTATYT